MQGQLENPALGKTLRDLQLFSIFIDPAAYFSKMIPLFITLGLIIGSVVAFFMLLLGAIRWISSGGDKSGLESAQKQITNAIIGIVLLFSVFALFTLLELVFGIKLISIDLTPLFIK